MSNQMEQRLRQMGMSPGRANSQESIARTLRQADKGVFGAMDIIDRQKRGDFR